MKKDIHQLIAEALKKQSENEPLAKQILFDEKLKEAVEALKSFNREELKRIETKKHIFWRMLAITSTALTFILLIASPVEIGNLVAEKVRENVVDPNVKESLNRTVKENASDYIETQLGPFKKSVDDLRNQLSDLRATITEAESLSRQAQSVTGDLQKQSNALGIQLVDINSALGIISLIARADNDDRMAFDGLLAQAVDDKSPYRDVAGEVVMSIATASNLKMGQQLSSIPWKDVYNIESPDKLDIDQIKTLLRRIPRADLRGIFLQYVWEQARFSKYDKLDFSAWMIRADQSISNVRDAMQTMDADSGIKKILLKYKDYITWWDQNKEKYRINSSMPQAVSPH